MEIDTKNLIQDLKAAELTIKNMIDLIKNDIRTNISEHPDPDIKMISKSPAICIVSLKHVKQHNNMSNPQLSHLSEALLYLRMGP